MIEKPVSKKRARIYTIALSVLFVHPAVSYADAGLLRTIQPLDETRGYCLDIRGDGGYAVFAGRTNHGEYRLRDPEQYELDLLSARALHASQTANGEQLA